MSADALTLILPISLHSFACHVRHKLGHARVFNTKW